MASKPTDLTNLINIRRERDTSALIIETDASFDKRLVMQILKMDKSIAVLLLSAESIRLEQLERGCFRLEMFQAMEVAV